MARPLVPGSGSARYFHVSVSWSSILKNPAGIWISGFQSRPPASTSKTLVPGSSVNRLASTQPAEPAPTMM
jgi:hypothetical protein